MYEDGFDTARVACKRARINRPLRSTSDRAVGLLLLNSLIFARQGPGRVAAVARLTAGIVVLNIMSGAFLGDASRLVHVREQGILQRAGLHPLPPAVLILAYTGVRLLLVLLQSALITAVAVVALGARFAPAAVLLAVPGVLHDGLLERYATLPKVIRWPLRSSIANSRQPHSWVINSSVIATPRARYSAYS